MDIHFQLYNPAEILAFADYCKAIAAIRADQSVAGVGQQGSTLMGPDTLYVAEAKMATEPGPTETATATEEPKKTRATKSKVETKEPVAETAKKQVEDLPLQNPKEEPPAITKDEARNCIIDYLNDWSEAMPGDPDVRVRNLKPILEALDAEKIGTIDPAKYHLVAGLVDDGRAKLAEFKAQSSVEE